MQLMRELGQQYLWPRYPLSFVEFIGMHFALYDIESEQSKRLASPEPITWNHP